MTSAPAPDLGVYIHWPYCARICPYCDFNVVRDRGHADAQAALVTAIATDLRRHAEAVADRTLVSIFFGGGTPSLMAPDAVSRLIETATSLWPAAADLEISLEANPTDAEAQRFADLARAGVNRLSLGLQSLTDKDLRFLGRNHDAATGARAAERAGALFPRVSLDLIYALPGQTVSAWEQTLGRVASLGADHISPYQLTIEGGTAFDRAVRRGQWSPPVEDLAADLYEATQTVLEAAAYEAYEVSNHARGPSARSRHNLIYWQGGDYVGAGPGAHGRLTLEAGRFATVSPRRISDYVGSVCGPIDGAERLSPREIALERMLMGLRTVEGVNLADLSALDIPEIRFADLGDLVTLDAGRLTVTRCGRPVLDRITAVLADGA